jgi:signal transduction histidine kinase
VPALKHYGSEDRSKPPTRLDAAYEKVGEVIATKKAATEISLIGDAEHCVLLVPINRENKVIGVVALHKDNTTPYTEHEIELAQRVISRAAIAIENARLYAKVQAADKAKSEFVGIVAHDLKVPMTSILGYANLTKMVGDDEDNLVGRQGEFLDKIVNTVSRMEVLVSDLSDISRVETGYFRMDEISVSVMQIVQGVKDTTLSQIEARGHTFIEDIEPDLPDMWVDFYRLMQVLTNLVSNAYKYTPEGGTITLSVRQSGSRIRFSVSDTGIGLSKHQVAKMGMKFWRATDQYTRSQPGTGLGFAITSSLVELMGSYIHIESEVGKGSTFSFSIATATEEDDPDATQLMDAIPGFDD